MFSSFCKVSTDDEKMIQSLREESVELKAVQATHKVSAHKVCSHHHHNILRQVGDAMHTDSWQEYTVGTRFNLTVS